MSLRRFLYVALLAGLPLAAPLPAHAQLSVFDSANFSQNILTALRTLQSNVNELRQIANQIEQINHEIKNLQTLPAGITGALLGDYVRAWTEMTHTFNAINGLAANLGTLTVNYNALFPALGANDLGHADVLQQLEHYLAQARQSYQGVYQQSGQVMASLPRTQGNLSSALAASTGANGNLDALQANTQVSAQIAQLLVLQNGQIAAMNQAQADWLNQQMLALDTTRRMQIQSEELTPQTQPPAAYLPAMH